MARTSRATTESQSGFRSQLQEKQSGRQFFGGRSARFRVSTPLLAAFRYSAFTVIELRSKPWIVYEIYDFSFPHVVSALHALGAGDSS